MIVIPAIDLRGGRAVRLRRGDPSEETAYDEDPVALAQRFQEEGARRLHVIDLDAALGEGIRSMDEMRAVSDDGGARGILGTAAAADASFVARIVEEFAERVVVAVDVRGGRVMTNGWREEGPELEPTLAALDAAGTPRFLVTAIARDGTLEGPDLTLYRQVLALTERPVIASGGVRNAEDVWALREVGGEAVVTGKALYERTLKLSQVTRG